MRPQLLAAALAVMLVGAIGRPAAAVVSSPQTHRSSGTPNASGQDTLTAISLLSSLSRSERRVRRMTGFGLLGLGTYSTVSLIADEGVGSSADADAQAATASLFFLGGGLLLAIPSRAETAIHQLEAVQDARQREEFAHAAVIGLAESAKRRRFILGGFASVLAILAATDDDYEHSASVATFFGAGALASLLVPSRDERFLRRLEQQRNSNSPGPPEIDIGLQIPTTGGIGAGLLITW